MPPIFSEDRKTVKFFQTSFKGGMRRDVDPSLLGEDEYTYLSNGRTRYGVVQPINLPLDISEQLPAGKYQGIFGAGYFIVVYIDGKAYFRDFSANPSYFKPIPDFQMSADVDIIYSELVPASTVNYTRQAIGTASDGVKLTDIGSGSPAIMVVQDGVSRPRFINGSAGSGILQDYADWTLTGNREYVPIGTHMHYQDGILYLVSADRKQIFRSVTGRPLDFMVIVDSNGDKLDPKDGSAENVSHRVDFDDITCLEQLNLTTTRGFFVSTNKNSYVVTPNTQKLIFGEPTFSTGFLFSTGCLNDVSVTDILGDTAFIDFSSVRSFNAIQQTTFEGNNAPFSKEVFPFFENIKQTVTASITFDNYGLFAVNTIYGYGILVYDTILKKWVAFDQYPGVGAIKQFKEIKLPDKRLLFFITTDNKIYEAYSGALSTVTFYSREFCANEPDVELNPDILRSVFIDAKTTGTVTSTIVVDRKATQIDVKSVKLLAPSSISNPPFQPPFAGFPNATVENRTFNLPRTTRGWKVGVLMVWNFDAQLQTLAFYCTTQIMDASITEAASKYAK